MKYDDLARSINRHGSEWTEQVKCCSTCGHLVAFGANGSPCQRNGCDGAVRPIIRYVDTFQPDVPQLLRLAEQLRETRERVRDGEIKGTRDMKQIADGIEEAVANE